VIPDGYNGDPASLKPDLAEAFLDAEARSMAALIESHLKNLYLPPHNRVIGKD
jgi:hypothetical protein